MAPAAGSGVGQRPRPSLGDRESQRRPASRDDPEREHGPDESGLCGERLHRGAKADRAVARGGHDLRRAVPAGHGRAGRGQDHPGQALRRRRHLSPLRSRCPPRPERGDGRRGDSERVGQGQGPVRPSGADCGRRHPDPHRRRDRVQDGARRRRAQSRQPRSRGGRREPAHDRRGPDRAQRAAHFPEARRAPARCGQLHPLGQRTGFQKPAAAMVAAGGP